MVVGPILIQTMADVFCDNENGPNFLFKSNGDGTFVDKAKVAGVYGGGGGGGGGVGGGGGGGGLEEGGELILYWISLHVHCCTNAECCSAV